MIRWWKSAAAALVTVLAVSLAGCISSAGSGPSGRSSSPTPVPSDAAVTESTVPTSPPPEPSESVVPGAGEHGQPAPAFEQRQVDGVVDALRSLSCGRWRGPAPERATQEREGSPEPTRTVLTLRFADVIEARQFAATFDPACAEGWRITSAQRGRSVVLEALRQ